MSTQPPNYQPQQGYPQSPQQQPYSNYQQPSYPPPQRPKPVLYRLWDKWLYLWRNHRPIALILPAIVIVIVGSAVISGIVQGVQQSQPQATSPTATTIPATAIPQAQTTQAVAVTPTKVPTPKPTVSFTQQVNQQATNDAVAAAQFAVGGSINSNYDSSAKSVVITEALQEPLNTSDYVTEIKSDCFSIQQKVWQDTSLKLSTVEIHMSAAGTDQFGHPTTLLAGSCTLSASQEANFNWSNLDYETAWDNNDYDLTYLDPSLTK